ncbi:VPA1269 family protein [Pseudomonas aeruginosa]|uniref:VPA1269 family protein n=1 Tax=Pseudomonas aeruginosa TaxID=287 RepID=UPI001ADC2D3E|nr:VPA1269 family protein [Pseudomonas aeruginosa]
MRADRETGLDAGDRQDPLPYRYIQQLRQILCRYAHGSEQEDSQEGAACNARWTNRHLRDWSVAHEHVFYAWFEVEPEIIDRDDPDCVWRAKVVKRKNTKTTIHQMWSPVTAMLLFVKLHLPLRTYQVAFSIPAKPILAL